MCANKKDVKPALLLSVFGNKCPRCRRGALYANKGAFRFKGLMKMNEQCPVCGQSFEMEPGFYYGTNLISYALAILLSVVSLIAWIAIIGVSLQDKRFLWWIGVNAVLLIILQPLLMRLSRTIWLTFFVPYSSRWAEGDVLHPERINKEQMNNW